MIAKGKRTARRFREVSTVTAGITIGALTAGGVAVAAHTTPNVITACKSSNGSVRLVDSGASCRSNEVVVQWNQEGVEGEKGETGSEGPSGPSGISGYERIESPVIWHTTNPGTSSGVVLSCARTKKVLSGGFSIYGAHLGAIENSKPLSDGFSWHFLAVKHGPAGSTYDFSWQAYIICADAS